MNPIPTPKPHRQHRPSRPILATVRVGVREHRITAKLTKPYSPTTTGKVERWHQTLRRELQRLLPSPLC